jgi:glycosyltransferase involved in cell wall biosynthesis
MVHYSVLIPARDATAGVERILPPLCQALERLILPYEIVCVDDASSPAEGSALERLLPKYPALRVLRFDQARGVSAALSAGIAASRGDLVIAMDAQAVRAPHFVAQLISRLAQHEFVFTKFAAFSGAMLGDPLVRLGRSLAARTQLASSEGFFWAARREAVSGLALARGAFRVLPGMVARRGYRVGLLSLVDGLSPRGAAYTPGPLERLIIRWLDRRYEPHLAMELARGGRITTRLPSGRVPARVRLAPRSGIAEAIDSDHLESA